MLGVVALGRTQTWRRNGRCISENSALARDCMNAADPGLTPGATLCRRYEAWALRQARHVQEIRIGRGAQTELPHISSPDSQMWATCAPGYAGQRPAPHKH